MKDRNNGEKTRLEPAQDRQKRMLREPQNAGIADKFPPESSEKSGKIMDTERKISHTVRKKLENDSKGEEKMPGNGKRKPKKQAFPSKRIQEKHWKNGNGMKKFLSTGQKISRWSEKISKTDDPDERTTELFLPADNRKMQEKKQEETKKSIKPIPKRHE